MGLTMGGSTACPWHQVQVPGLLLSYVLMGKSSRLLDLTCELKLSQGFNRLIDIS